MADEQVMERPALVSPPPPQAGPHRFAMLDGWRAVSILFVMAGHLLPIGPSRWGLNYVAATGGMAIFFTLSGFLITRFLGQKADIRVFAIRRLTRIVPLAWIALAVTLTIERADGATVLANILFYANLPPDHIIEWASHLWSLDVEMQFYLGVALLVGVAGHRALYVLPLLCLGVTGLRIAQGIPISIVTWLRADEILAGGILSLVYMGWFGPRPIALVRRCSVFVTFPLFLACSLPIGGPLAYLRPYAAALMVGSTLYDPPKFLARLFEHRVTAYIATISYALYIIHGILRMTWLGDGDSPIQYVKRPLLFAATFLLAHLSTFYMERPLTEAAKRWTRRWTVKV